MAQQSASNVALCPECDGAVKLSGKLYLGRKLSCRQCGSVLVVADRKPLELVLADDQMPLRAQSKVDKRNTTDKDASYYPDFDDEF